MTAKGKINASNVTTGDRIIVKLHRNDAGLYTHTTESATKTGEGVIVARVIGKSFRAAQGPYEARGKYIIETTVGDFEAAPIQTMWLAPEDAAGIKRALAEAKAEDEDRTAAAEREAAKAAAEESYLESERALAAQAAAEAPAVQITEAQHAEVNERHRANLATQAAGRTLRLTIAADAKPALETLAKVSAGLGATLRPILEAGVRLARTIPEGRRRHGQTKARRDALRHARKLELANL